MPSCLRDAIIQPIPIGFMSCWSQHSELLTEGLFFPVLCFLFGWYQSQCLCIRWNGFTYVSESFNGIRQGGILSPILLAQQCTESPSSFLFFFLGGGMFFQNFLSVQLCCNYSGLNWACLDQGCSCKLVALITTYFHFQGWVPLLWLLHTPCSAMVS